MKHPSYTGIPSPEVETLLDEALPRLAAEIDALGLPKLAGVVLGGGYGRGEGGVLRTPEGDKLYNDLDFFVFADNADKAELAKIDRELPKLAEPWEKRLGVAVDFGPAKNLSALKNVARTLMYQELRHGWRPVWGDVDLDTQLPDLPPDKLPFTEAARLLLNRGMGLVFAAERLLAGSDDHDFIVRNMNKALLGGGDAMLIAAERYRWPGSERTTEFRRYCGEEKLPAGYADLYESAYRFKLEPRPILPPAPLEKWKECRDFYLAAFANVAGTSGGAAKTESCAALRRKAASERSPKNFLRWLVRMRGIRSVGRLFDAPVITVLESLYEILLREEPPRECPKELYRAWLKFN